MNWKGGKGREDEEEEEGEEEGEAEHEPCGSCTICCTPFRCTPKTVPGTPFLVFVGTPYALSLLHRYIHTYIYIYTYSRSDAGIPRICNVLPVFSITPFHHDFRKPCATYPVCAFLSVLSRYFFIGSLLYDSFL